MKKNIWFWIIGVVLLIVIAIYFILTSNSYNYEVKVYKDGKNVGTTSSNGAMCSIMVGIDACGSFGFKQYDFVVEQLDEVTGISSIRCLDEFKNKFGQEIKGFCTMESVHVSMNKIIDRFDCRCWN